MIKHEDSLAHINLESIGSLSRSPNELNFFVLSFSYLSFLLVIQLLRIFLQIKIFQEILFLLKWAILN